MEKLMLWFESLEQREKRLVSLGAIAVLITLFYLLVFEPTQNRLNKARVAYGSAQDLNIFMQQTKQKVENLKKQTKQPNIKVISNENLLAFLDASMNRFGIASQMNSISPGKEKGASLRFDSVSYNKLMSWLSSLYFENGINVVSISVTPTASQGIVKASMLLE